MTSRRFAAPLLVALAVAAAPARAADAVIVQAEVASSVTAPFKQFVELYQKMNRSAKVDAKYLGGQVIQGDVESEAPIDFVIVGKNQTDKLAAHIESPVPILTNREVVLVQKGSTKVKSLKDLAAPGIRVALGTAESAVGSLARGVLKKAILDPGYGPDFAQKVRANTTVEAASGVDVVNAVAEGRADAAIAFVSDVDPARFSGVQIPPSLNVDSVYYAFVPKSAKHPQRGRELVRLAGSRQGQAILHAYRYLPPPKS